MYSVYWDAPPLYGFLAEDPSLFKPAASILGYGISDYHLMLGEIKDPFTRQLSDAANIAFLGAIPLNKDLLDVVSPALHVSQSTPPTFLWATTGDELIPVENTNSMANALARAGRMV